ncbi:hypothetical protein [Solidesulfovibrio carbinolicus]|uniref:hypothetical protein n=1 Tax=Solidesulfovibrio carbinolicus TaxID=296842 RepID=UPI0013EB282F|nr:hypothetical protein [Solidesulfovibrio carbinolicus]
MKPFTIMTLILVLALSSFALQGCGESEQAKLEKERTQLEIEKLKREAEEQASRKKSHDEFLKTDKIKDYKANVQF